MTELAFLSPSACEAGVRLVSPLARVLAKVGPRDSPRDLSHLGKIEVRGELDGVDLSYRVVTFGPGRSLVLCEPDETLQAIEELRDQARFVLDQSAAFAAIEIGGEELLRRLTDLDPAALPAAGAFARVRAIVDRWGDDTFLVLVAQEHGHYVCEYVLDAMEGLGT
jgi:sarcosine oxidase gamma subunit